MKNILITGCTGNLGSALTENLISSGYSITGIAKDAKKNKQKKPNFKFIQVDIADEKLFTSLKNLKIDLIIHTAALIPKRSQGLRSEKLKMFKSNVFGTLNILRLMEEKGIKNLIFTSSMTVYGFPKYLPVNENHPLEPVSFYGLTKKHAEEYVEKICQENEFYTCIFRFPGFFSPKIRSGAIYSFCTKALANKEIIIDLNSPIYWDTFHIKDAVNVITNCLERLKSNPLDKVEIFNVDYGVPINLIRIAKKIVKISKSKSTIKKIGNEKSIDFFFDLKKIKKALKWSPPSLEERIKEYLSEI